MSWREILLAVAWIALIAGVLVAVTMLMYQLVMSVGGG